MTPFKLGWFHSGPPCKAGKGLLPPTRCHPHPRCPFQSCFPSPGPTWTPEPSPPPRKPNRALPFPLRLSWGDMTPCQRGPGVHRAFSLPEHASLSLLQAHGHHTIWCELPWSGKFGVKASLPTTWRPQVEVQDGDSRSHKAEGGREAQTEEGIKGRKQDPVPALRAAIIPVGQTSVTMMFLPPASFPLPHIY